MGDAVAWLPRYGILFTGDAVVNGAFNYTGDSDTASWINVLNELDELPIKKIAPGIKGCKKPQKHQPRNYGHQVGNDHVSGAGTHGHGGVEQNEG